MQSRNNIKSNQKKREEMKKFNLTGNTAVWDALRVEATNNGKGRTEKLSAIPEGKVLTVALLDGFDPANPSTENISASDSSYVFRHGRRRNFLLRYNGVCVGWATFHRAERNYDVAVSATFSSVVSVKAKSAEEAERKAVESLEAAVAEYNATAEVPIELDDYEVDATESWE